MSKRFYYDEFLEEIYDEQIDDYPSNQSICGILNQQAERIAELEEQLKNATKQVRKKVCEEIRTFAYDTFKEFGCFDETDLEHILDQIQEDKQ